MRAPIVVVAAMVSLTCTSCYLTHERGADAGTSADTAPRDAAPVRCDQIVFGAAALLDGTNGVTPRLVALDEGAVGVVYVVPGAGAPTEVWFERFDTSLARATGPVLVARDAWTWAEPARVSTGLVVGFGSSARAAPSMLVSSDLEGHGTHVATPIALQNPAVLQPSRGGLFWLAMEMHERNAFVLAHLGADGALLHEARRIDLGRYGSGFGVASRPDGSGEVLAYPSEGPPGVRRARLIAISADGSLSSEHTLSMDGADAALPIFVGDTLEVVYRADAELRIAAIDAVTLDTQAERSLARLDGGLFAAAIGGRLVLGALGAGRVTAVDATTPGASPIEMATPLSGTSGALDWARGARRDRARCRARLGVHQQPVDRANRLCALRLSRRRARRESRRGGGVSGEVTRCDDAWPSPCALATPR